MLLLKQELPYPAEASYSAGAPAWVELYLRAGAIYWFQLRHIPKVVRMVVIFKKVTAKSDLLVQAADDETIG